MDVVKMLSLTRRLVCTNYGHKERRTHRETDIGSCCAQSWMPSNTSRRQKKEINYKMKKCTGTISPTKTLKKCFRRVVSFRFSLSFFIFHFLGCCIFHCSFACSSSIRLRENGNLVFHLRLTYMHRGRMPRICFSRLRSAGQLGLKKAVKTWLLQSNAVNRQDLASRMPALSMMYLKLTHPKDPNLR